MNIEMTDPTDFIKNPKDWKKIATHEAHLAVAHHIPVVAVYFIQERQLVAMVYPGWKSSQAQEFLDAPGTLFFKLWFKACDEKPPRDASAALLAQLIAGEATVAINNAEEMAAIAYTACNRVSYLQSHPKVNISYFGAKDRTLTGVINKNQYASVGLPKWNQALDPSELNIMTSIGAELCSYYHQAYTVAQGVVDGKIKDPFAAHGGTYAMRTAGHGSPGGDFFQLPSEIIKGSGNVFFGLSQ